MTQAVIFDMDGVLVLSEDAHYRAWRDTGAMYGTSVSREVFLSCFGRVNADCVRIIIGDVSESRAIEIADRKERAYREFIRENVPLAPGLVPLLETLRSNGIVAAIGSSAPPENVAMIVEAGRLHPYFRARVDGSMVRLGKPAPDIFLKAAELSGIASERCAVIEDAPAGIIAARAAGMLAIGVATTHTWEQLKDAGAHHVFPTLADVPLGLLGIKTDDRVAG